MPYRDPFYYSRRPTIAVPAGSVLQIGTDSRGIELGLHPRLTGLKSIFDAGRLAIVQRTGYANSEPLAFHRASTSGARPTPTQLAGHGLAGPLPRLAAVSRSIRWSAGTRSARRRAADGAHSSACRRSPVPATYASPARTAAPRPSTSGRRRRGSHRICPSIVRTWRSSTRRRRRRSARSIAWRRSPRIAGGDLSEQRLRAGAAGRGRRDEQAASARRCSGCRPAASTRTPARASNQGAYFNLMATLSDGLMAFYDDLSTQGLLNNTAGHRLLGVRPPHHRERQPGHRSRRRRHHDGCSAGWCAAASTAPPPNLRLDPANPTLENNAGDVKYETDFRSVYAQVIDSWLGANSVDDPRRRTYRAGAPAVL